MSHPIIFTQYYKRIFECEVCVDTWFDEEEGRFKSCAELTGHTQRCATYTAWIMIFSHL